MIRTLCTFVIVTLLVSVVLAEQQKMSAADWKVWSLEETYWRDVQATDLVGYRSLWHENFLGWPSVSPEPVRKAHITDWITDHTSKGDTLKSYSLELCVVQITGDLATTTYRVMAIWADKNGTAAPTQTIRVIHTWLRDPSGTWHIISGMSAPTNAQGH